jgi:hypothetical protein
LLNSECNSFSGESNPRPDHLPFIFNEFSLQTIIGAVISGVIISALFYSLGFKLLKKTAEKLGKTVPEVSLEADERLVLETAASHYKGIEKRWEES